MLIRYAVNAVVQIKKCLALKGTTDESVVHVKMFCSESQLIELTYIILVYALFKSYSVAIQI